MIDSEKVIKLIKIFIQPNLKTLLLISVLIFLILKYFDTNIIVIVSLFVYIFASYKDIMKTFQEINNEGIKEDKIIEDNRRTIREIQYDNKIKEIVRKLKKFRKYNKRAYDEGHQYLRMFMYTLHDLERDDISHPRQYFENAQMYIQNALNAFHSITVSVPEEKLIHALKYNKYETMKIGNRIGELMKQLHKHTHYLLYNLSLRFNKDFFENSNNYKNEITINSENVRESNVYTEDQYF